MNIGINESKTLTKHISWNYEFKFDSRECNSNQKWNNETCQCECKNYQTCKENYIWNPSTCIINISMIICDKIINTADGVSTNVTSSVSTNFHNEKSKI